MDRFVALLPWPAFALPAGAETVFQFTPTLIALPFVGGLVLLGMIPWLWRFRGGAIRHYSLVALLMVLLMALFLLIAIGPAMVNDRVVVTPQGVTQYTGPAWDQNSKGFSLDGLELIRITYDDRNEEVWTAFYRNGSTIEVSGGDLWDLHSEEIKQLLRERGVVFR
jgi:hypothetical protein